MDDIYPNIAPALNAMRRLIVFGDRPLTVRFLGLNNVVLGAAQTRGKAIL